MKIDNILVEKFNRVTDFSAKDLVEKSKTNAEVALALDIVRTPTGVKAGDYEIVIEKFNINGLEKNYYNIVDNEYNDVLYKEIAMFESAISILKKLITQKNINKCNDIAKLDEEYDRNLLEAYGYKHRLKNTSNMVKRDVYEAKYSNAMAKVKDSKARILKTL